MVSSVEETPEPISTNIIGQIPEWVNGNFLRNGPGKFEIGNQKWVNRRSSVSVGHRAVSPTPICSFFTRFNHWFDGMALMHQFKLAKGQVTYKSRFLSSDSYQTNKENNRITVSEFGTVTLPDPCKNVFQRFLSRFELPSRCLLQSFTSIPTLDCLERSAEPTDNANVSFVTYKGDYYVSTETKIIHKLDPEKLEATQKVSRC